ncbi:MAG: CYTH domain-containing protein [Candidatus Neomarinimicrobiota bacterium]
MAIEIERKFLVTDDRWRNLATGVFYRQGYLSTDPNAIVRVRIAGEQGFLTAKGRSAGLARMEFEYPIPVADAQIILDNLCRKPLIEKYRYTIPIDGLTWEVDKFTGVNAGLIVAEVELPEQNHKFSKPDWVGREISDDPRYFNANLVDHPFEKW